MLIEKQATVVKETIFLWQMIAYINRKKMKIMSSQCC